MVIPNPQNEAGPSGTKKYEENHVQSMEYEQDGLPFNAFGLPPKPTVHFAPHSFWTSHHPLNLGPEPELPMIHMPRLDEIMQPQHQAQKLPQSTFYNGSVSNGKLFSIQIPSELAAGYEVGVVGSWDNWQTIEYMQLYGNDLLWSKLLPLGLHYYRFVGAFTIDEKLTWVRDAVGNFYNILNLQEDAPVVHENHESVDPANAIPAFSSEYESPPPSPPSSYDNKIFYHNEFFDKDGDLRQPPELPPQLEATVLQIPSRSNDNSRVVSRPHFTQLDHLFVSKTKGNQHMGFSSIQRFPDKYVTGVLFKESAIGTPNENIWN